MPYNKNQIELDKTISTLVLKTSMLIFEETELYLESNEKSNKKDFHNNLENHYEVIIKGGSVLGIVLFLFNTPIQSREGYFPSSTRSNREQPTYDEKIMSDIDEMDEDAPF